MNLIKEHFQFNLSDRLLRDIQHHCIVDRTINDSSAGSQCLCVLVLYYLFPIRFYGEHIGFSQNLSQLNILDLSYN